MKKIVEVRNLKIGEGIPKICVPLVGKTDEEIISEAEYLKFQLKEEENNLKSDGVFSSLI